MNELSSEEGLPETLEPGRTLETERDWVLGGDPANERVSALVVQSDGSGRLHGDAGRVEGSTGRHHATALMLPEQEGDIAAGQTHTHPERATAGSVLRSDKVGDVSSGPDLEGLARISQAHPGSFTFSETLSTSWGTATTVLVLPGAATAFRERQMRSLRGIDAGDSAKTLAAELQAHSGDSAAVYQSAIGAESMQRVSP